RAASRAPSLEPTPCDTTPVPFTSLTLDPRLQEGLRDLGYKETRPIQTAVIPLALAGHDLIGCAETGTGKTAAFVVPILQKLVTADLKVRTTTETADLKVRTTTDIGPCTTTDIGPDVVQAFRPADTPSRSR